MNQTMKEHNSQNGEQKMKTVSKLWKNVWNDVNTAEMSQADGASRVLLTRSGCCVSEKWRCKT